MDYIELLNQGNVLVCNYKDIQEDMCGGIWTIEKWHKHSNRYICEYVNCDFITTHSLNELKCIWKAICKMIDEDEVIVEIRKNED